MDRRDAVTIRFPTEVVAQAKELQGERESLNDFVVAAVEREVRRRRSLEAYEAILDAHRQLAHKTPHSDSVQLIRSLREGIARRD